MKITSTRTSPRGSQVGSRQGSGLAASGHRASSTRSVISGHTSRSVINGRPARGRLVDPALISRLEGVREDLEASRERGEVTDEQLRKFLMRLEERLLAEQGGTPAG